MYQHEKCSFTQTAVYSVSEVAVTISKVRCYKRFKTHMRQAGGVVGSNKPGFSPRRPVFVSRAKPKVNVVTVVYSCYSNSGCVVFF